MKGREVKGSRSWFRFGDFGIQPAEFMKFATNLALAKFLSNQNIIVNQQFRLKLKDLLKNYKNTLIALAFILSPLIIIKVLQELKNINEKTTIIELGSTKVEIVTSVPASIRSNFIAAHPMTGTEKNGPSAAIQNLYHDKIVVLCDTDNSGDLHKNRAIQIYSIISFRFISNNIFHL